MNTRKLVTVYKFQDPTPPRPARKLIKGIPNTSSQTTSLPRRLVPGRVPIPLAAAVTTDPLPNFENVSIRLPSVGGPLPVYTKVDAPEPTPVPVPVPVPIIIPPTLKPTLKIPVKSIKPVIPPAPEGDRRSRIKAFVNSFF